MQAAYFLSRHDHLGRPFDDAIIRGLFKAGCRKVHLYVPGPLAEIDNYSDRVTTHLVEYRLQWFKRNLTNGHWRDYALFLGACNLPMAFAGPLALFARRPLVTACDEIYTGRVSPATKYWEILAKFSMRHAKFTIITDKVRCELQRSYAGLTGNHRFLEVPCCFATPYDGPSTAQIRRRLGIPLDAFVLALTGNPHDASGGPELIALMSKRLPELHFLVQTAGLQDLTTDALFRSCQANYPLHYIHERTSWRGALEITRAADVGLVVYRQRAPQFQNMGYSSNKLCNHLLLAQPIIALRQPSFQFIEDYQCGVLVESLEDQEIARVLQRLRDDYEAFSQNARRCVQEYLLPHERVQALAGEFGKLL